MSKIFWSCLFSLNPRTTLELRKIFINAKHLIPSVKVPHNDIPPLLPDKKTLLDKCRHLLYTVNIKEEQWLPEENNPSGYYIQDEMLCDRYDEESFLGCNFKQ